MSYQLILAEPPAEGKITRDVGDNVFLSDLPKDCKVYAFYYGGAMRNDSLVERLKTLGEITGKNLFVNIGQLNDPKYDEIQRRFEIQKFPVIIVTAIDTLASPTGQYLTAFVRLDSRRMLDSPDRTTECLQELFNLFLNGKVAEAMANAKWQQRKELLTVLTKFFGDALKSVKDFVLGTEISVSLLQGKFELKHRGA
jgi:hypothetical protein